MCASGRRQGAQRAEALAPGGGIGGARAGDGPQAFALARGHKRVFQHPAAFHGCRGARRTRGRSNPLQAAFHGCQSGGHTMKVVWVSSDVIKGVFS